MTGYADPELLLSAWLHGVTGRKVWCDPRLPQNWVYDAPAALLNRGAGEGDTQLTLDSVVIDVDWYGKNADHVREWAETTRSAIRFDLPRHTFDNGIFVTGTSTITAPCWAPEFERGTFRRTASYRVILHGFLT